MVEKEYYNVFGLEILGLEVKQVPVPKWLAPHDSRPLFSYKLFMSYQGHKFRHTNRARPGHCALILKTSAVNYDGLATVQGHIYLKNYPLSELERINYRPKGKIDCDWLESLVSCYIASGGLGDSFFEERMITKMKNKLFTCDRELLSIVHGDNEDGTFDRVSMDLSLFEKI